MIKQKTLYREGDQGYMYIDSAGYFKVSYLFVQSTALVVRSLKTADCLLPSRMLSGHAEGQGWRAG